MKKNLLFWLVTLASYAFACAIPQPCPSVQTTSSQEVISEEVQPQILVVMGLTGDLGQRKLIPALYQLFQQGLLPKNFVIVGSARSALDSKTFQKLIYGALDKALPADQKDPDLWQQFMAKCLYHQTDLIAGADYQKLNLFLKDVDAKFGTQGNRLFYLAIPPSFFPTVITHLHDKELVAKPKNHSEPWSRIIIEKPFGQDLLSAQELQEHISQYFDNSQIYLIDHFLGKEMVLNLLPLRLSNPLLEQVWNRHSIEHVQITCSEDRGMNGVFWDEYGLLRDIVQNHLTQILALVAMEPPATMEPEEIRAEKIKVVQAIRPFDISALNKQIVHGQYGPGIVQGESVPGYRQEPGMPAQSNTETFVAAKLYIDNERWQGVPFYLRSGKRLAERLTEIVITFKQDLPNKLFANQLVLRVQPDEEIYLTLRSKLPGVHGEMDTLKMSLNYEKTLGMRIPDAYEVLLFQGMLGSANMFVSVEETLASWRLFTPVLKAWEAEEETPFPNYASGTWGPKEADMILEPGHKWHAGLDSGRN